MDPRVTRLCTVLAPVVRRKLEETKFNAAHRWGKIHLAVCTPGDECKCVRRGCFLSASQAAAKETERSRKIAAMPEADLLSESKKHAALLYESCNWKGALEIYQNLLRVANETAGPESEEAVKIASDISSCYYELGEYTTAISGFRLVLLSQSKLHGEVHHNTLAAASDLASALRKNKELDEAVGILKHVCKVREMLFEKTDKATLFDQTNLSILYIEQGNHVEAIALLKLVLAVDNERVDAWINLASAYVVAKNNKAAVVSLELAQTVSSDPDERARILEYSERIQTQPLY